VRHEIAVVRIRVADVVVSDVVCAPETIGPWRKITGVEQAGKRIVLQADGWNEGYPPHDLLFIQSEGALLSDPSVR
jgi:hypothetical protein